jgi:phosphatidylinositol N-acetylglucosaminyltransferase subunit A
LEKAIWKVEREEIPVYDFHDTVKTLYNWRYVAGRVERVYENIQSNERPSTLGRLKSSLSLGPIAGPGHLLTLIIDLIMLFVWECIYPSEYVDEAYDFDYEKYI